MFYNRQFDNSLTQADYLALANIGVTVGRYFFSDNLFIRARGGSIPVDTAPTPECSIGLEFQPTRYLFKDFDYGFYKGKRQSNITCVSTCNGGCRFRV